MLEAKEVGIGNYFSFNNPEAWKQHLNDIVVITKVKEGVSEKKKEVWKDSFGSVSFYLLKDKNETFNQFSQYIKPIPLTEEILLRLGFVKEHNTDESENRDCFYINNCDDSFYFNYDDIAYEGWYLGVTNYGYLSSLIYLHELQNLLYSLCKQELTLKP